MTQRKKQKPTRVNASRILSHDPGWEQREIDRYRAVYDAAIETSPTAAVAALKEVVRLQCRLEDKHVAQQIAAEADPILRAAMMRDAAAASGSHVAAGAADREVAARTAQAEQARRDAERERLEHVSDEDVMTMITDFASDLRAEDALRLATHLLQRPDVATMAPEAR